MFLQSARLVTHWRVVTATFMHESSRVDDSWQNHLFTSRDRCTTRDRTIYSRVINSGRLVTEALVHESWHMHDSSTLMFLNAHAIHSPYFNYTCIFLSISPLFYLNSWFFFNKHICLILFNINFLPTFQKKSCLFSKNSHVLSHPTHLFTNTYFLHTYLIHSHTFLTLNFPFPISFTA